MTEPLVTLKGVAKHFGDFTAVDAITFEHGSNDQRSTPSVSFGVTPTSVPTRVRGHDLWVPLFTAGGGGPTQWGTLFHLYHPATGGYLAFPPELAASTTS